MNEAPRRELSNKRVGASAPRGGLAVGALIAGLAFALSACGTMTTPPPQMPPRPLPAPTTPTTPAPPPPIATPAPVPPAPSRAPLTPPHVDGRDGVVRVAILLPFSARSAGARAEAASMLDAAQLALFESGKTHVLLIPKDTAGTSEGGRAAADSALRDGADVILGPLFADAVRTAGREAARARVPVIAFSNDRAVAQPGAVYVLGRTPEEEVERIVRYASIDFAERGGAQGGGSTRTLAETFDPFQPITGVGVRFGALTPDDAYGERVAAALQSAARAEGGSVTAWQRFPAGDATADRLTPAAQALAQRDAAGQLPYDAVLLPEGGVRLLSIAPLLPFYDVDPRQVRFLGTSLWADPSIAREPSLEGGLFPAPDPIVRERFVADYRSAYGAEPSRLAGLAYDAVQLVADVTAFRGAAGLDAATLARPDGFDGVEGRFRFRADGTAERSLAVLQIRRGRFEVVDPAPTSFSATGW